MSLNACSHKTCGSSHRGTAGPETPRVGQGVGGSAGHGSAHGWCHETVDGLCGKDPKYRLAPMPCHGWDAPHKVRRPVMALAPLAVVLLSLLTCVCPRTAWFCPNSPHKTICFCPTTPFLTYSLPFLCGAPSCRPREPPTPPFPLPGASFLLISALF